MSSNTAIALVQPHQAIQNSSVSYNKEQVQLIKDTYAKNASDSELALFIQIAQHKGLDIFSRQICLVPRYDSKTQKTVMDPQTTIDGYRLIAERTGKYEGQLGPFWCGIDGEWKDVWLLPEAPSAAKVGILKSGAREPFWAVAVYKEYVQTNRDGQPNSMWRKMPGNQLAKCAESLALRKAFPSELSGIYTQEEMGQANIDMSDDERLPQRPAQHAQTAATSAVSAEEQRINDALMAECIRTKGEKNGLAFFNSVWAKKPFADREKECRRLGLVTGPGLEVIDAEVIKPESVQSAEPQQPGRRGLLMEIIAELQSKLGNGGAQQMSEKIAALCDGETNIAKLSDGDIEGLIESFSQELDAYNSAQ